MTIHELDTPALICDLDVTERNLRAMQSVCDAHGKALRPHIKTHKVPELARWQLDLGAVGLTCAKIGEAEVMLNQAGCTDLFIAYSLVGQQKIERLKPLLDRADVRVSVVSEEQAKQLSAGLGGCEVKVRLNIDTGLGRDGMEVDAAIAAAGRIADLPGLNVVGVFTHEGHAHRSGSFAEALELGRAAADQLIAVAEAMRAAGIGCDEVAPGSTATGADLATYPGVTEVRPGTYIFYDAMCMEDMELTPEVCAARVITTVVDLPEPRRVIIDGGSKTFFNDQSEKWGRAYCVEHPQLQLFKCSEEHGHVEWRGEGAVPVKLGDRLTWIPNHICPVVNLFDEMNAVRGEEVVEVYRIAARGKIR